MLAGANLSNANLSDASLVGANLTSTQLQGANLTNTRLIDTVFANVDLTDVVGLENCKHDGPSIVDHRTLQKSNPLPLRFPWGGAARSVDRLPAVAGEPSHPALFLLHQLPGKG
jgi:hypothetical protein